MNHPARKAHRPATATHRAPCSHGQQPAKDSSSAYGTRTGPVSPTCRPTLTCPTPLSGAAALETQTHPNTGQRNHAGADISFTLMSACHTKCQDSTECTRTTAAQTPDRQQRTNGCETPIPVPELQGGDICSSLPLDKHRGMPAACHLHHPYPTLHLSNATTRQMPCKASPSRGLTPHPLAYLVCLIQFENLPQ